VLPDGAEARISGGRLDLPPITLRREWFTTLNNTCKLQLIDVEGDQQQQQQQDVDTEPPQQRHRPQRTLDQFFVRLAPYTEQLYLLPAGRLFENVVVKAQFAADWDTSLETRRLLVSTAAAAGQQTISGTCSSIDCSSCSQPCVVVLVVVPVLRVLMFGKGCCGHHV
jgi:hypothetical protein